MTITCRSLTFYGYISFDAALFMSLYVRNLIIMRYFVIEMEEEVVFSRKFIRVVMLD